MAKKPTNPATEGERFDRRITFRVTECQFAALVCEAEKRFHGPMSLNDLCREIVLEWLKGQKDK